MSNFSKSNLVSTRKIAAAGILTAMAVALMYLEFALPFMPVFLQFDFSELPVLIGAFSLGPVYGIIIEFLKNLIHCPGSHTQFIGEVSNFITGSIFVCTASMIYMKNRTRKGAIVGMAIATAVLTIISAPFNYFVTIPLYGSVLGLPLEAILGMAAAANPHVTSKLNLMFWVFMPFNLFKGIVISFITFWVYKPISRLINKTYDETHK